MHAIKKGGVGSVCDGGGRGGESHDGRVRGFNFLFNACGPQQSRFKLPTVKMVFVNRTNNVACSCSYQCSNFSRVMPDADGGDKTTVPAASTKSEDTNTIHNTWRLVASPPQKNTLGAEEEITERA